MQTFTARTSRQTLRAWFGRDYHFFIALEGGVPVSYRCLSRRVHPGVVGFIRLAPHQVFMVDEFTLPAFRRRGITRRLSIAMAPFLTAQGVREVLGIHRIDNQDTIAAARAKGIPRIGTVVRLRMLGRTSFVYEPASDAAPGWDEAGLRQPATVDLETPLAERGAA
jgi:GNAT superfamily N-acetyltransferase